VLTARAGIEDIAASEEEEIIDRAFASPEERLLILMKAREALGNMTRDELEDLSMSLDAPMVAAIQHILANPMYAPMEEGFAVSKQDLVRAGLPAGMVQRGFFDRVVARLERVGARRGLPALSRAVRGLSASGRQNVNAVMAALEGQL